MTETDAPARRAKRMCEGCYKYDNAPKHILGVTADGPLGLHPPAAMAKALKVLGPNFPSNMDAIGAMDAADAEEAVDALTDPERDAVVSWAFLVDPTTAILHFDCYLELSEELKLQKSLDDPTKVELSDHVLAGLDAGLRNDKLYEHMLSAPPVEEV